MTLNDLIESLELVDKTLPVYYDFADFYPVGIYADRGDYSQLAMGYATPDLETILPTVDNLLDSLKKSKGTYFTGYKGGEYYCDGTEEIWVAEFGQLSYTKVAGLLDEDGRCTILTKYEC